MTGFLVSILQKTGLYGLAKKIFRGLAALTPAAGKQKKAMLDFYKQFLNPGDICFDIGANVGDRTAAFLNCGAKVIVVDPQPVCITYLKKRFSGNSHVVLVEKALGQETGSAKMMLSDADTISSLSPQWIEKVKQSGRFADYKWDKSIEVPVTTLDKLIEEYGLPVFCKIDVEGFEYEVLQGLTKPMNVLSFEFTPEFKEATLKCVSHLKSLGQVEFNYSIGETMSLVFEMWKTPDDMTTYLNEIPEQAMFGDVYARFRL